MVRSYSELTDRQLMKHIEATGTALLPIGALLGMVVLGWRLQEVRGVQVDVPLFGAIIVGLLLLALLAVVSLRRACREVGSRL